MWTATLNRDQPIFNAIGVKQQGFKWKAKTNQFKLRKYTENEISIGTPKIKLSLHT